MIRGSGRPDDFLKNGIATRFAVLCAKNAAIPLRYLFAYLRAFSKKSGFAVDL